MEKYKNFLSKDYIDKNNSKKIKILNNLIMIVVIFNLLLFPKTVSNVYEMNKSIEVINEDIDRDIEVIDKEKNELIKILDLFDFNISYVDIKNGSGIIKMKNKEEIFYIDKVINIKSINIDLEGDYILGVELWRKKQYF